MKKSSILKILGVVAILIIGFLIYRDYQFNTVSTDPFSMNIAMDKSYNDVSVVGDVLYYRDKQTLYGIKKKEDTNEVIFSKELEAGIKTIIYDKYIYVVSPNSVELLNRKNGKTNRVIENLDSLTFAEKHGDNIIGYADKSAYIWSLDLKNEKKLSFDQTPAKVRKEGNLYSVILVNSDAGIIKSRYQVFENDKMIYDISSVDEVFLYSDFIGANKHIVATNRYIYLFEMNVLVKKTLVKNPIAFDSQNGMIAVLDYKSLKVYNSDLALQDNLNINFEVDKIKFRENSITIIGDRNVGVYENKNLLEMPIGEYQGIAINDFGTYIIFENRVEKVKSY